LKFAVACAFLLHFLIAIPVSAQQLDEPAIIRNVDHAVALRVNGIASYTVTEHYAVYRNRDEDHPAAEMTVKTTYSKETGKSYQILSESGSSILRKMVLGTILDNERQINQPGVREGSFFVSANYDMKLKSPQTELVDGRNCAVLAISPKRKVSNLIEGVIWVDVKDGTLVQIEGHSLKSPSMFSGPAQMTRQYVNIDGFAEATHARAVSDSSIFGQTIVRIDYSNYQIQLAAQPSAGER
jgi:hypothetical protein